MPGNTSADAAFVTIKGRGKDYTGMRFGLLTAIGPVGRTNSGGIAWLCSCDCGEVTRVAQTNLRRNRSCGCLRKATTRTHGHARDGRVTAEYRAWLNMRERCAGPGSRHYYLYGARGITICTRWLDGADGARGFECFLADMGPKPGPKHSLDRINGCGNYEPGNCRWATPHEQANNLRTNLLITVDGQTRTAAEWSRAIGVSRSSVYQAVRSAEGVEAYISKRLHRVTRSSAGDDAG
jgi:hypothetical protein